MKEDEVEAGRKWEDLGFLAQNEPQQGGKDRLGTELRGQRGN